MIQTQTQRRHHIHTELQQLCAAREAAGSRHDLASLLGLAARIDALLDEMATLRREA